MKGISLEERDKIEERRNSYRFRHAQPVRFQFKDPGQFRDCLSCDLSRGGIRVHLNDFVPLNTEVTLQIRLAGENMVDCAGYIAWVKKDRFGDHYQAGLEFAADESGMDSKRKIHEFLFFQ